MNMSQNNKKTLEEMIQELPPQVRHKLEDYALLLWEHNQSQKKEKQNKISTEGWRGALKDLRDQYTYVELQHKALDWWEKDVSR